MKRLLDWWNLFEVQFVERIAIIFFLGALGVMFFEALSRIIVSRSYSWSAEISVYGVVWAIFLSLARAGKRGKHIRTETLFEILPSGLKYWTRRLTSLLSFIFCLLLSWSSYKMVYHMFRTGRVSESTLQIPIWLIGLSMLVGSIFLCIYTMEQAFFGRHLGLGLNEHKKASGEQ